MTSATPTDLPSVVKARREALNLSREDLASRAGVSLRTVVRLEDGEAVRRATVRVITWALDLELREAA